MVGARIKYIYRSIWELLHMIRVISRARDIAVHYFDEVVKDDIINPDFIRHKGGRHR